MKCIVIIPARGGSRGIPKKNVRFMAGKPLISYAIACAKKCKFDLDVVVTSDDEEIKSVAENYGAEIVDRPMELAGDSITLDPVIYHAVISTEEKKGIKYDYVITMQPTSPLLSVETLEKAVEYFIKGSFDTVISGVNDPRLSWHIEGDICVPNYKERVNRQYMKKDLKETGAFVITKREFVREDSRFGKKISIYEMPEKEAGDIDTPQDWWIAETELNKKNILIRLDGYSKIGMGHIYRGLQLASGFIEHNIRFIISEKSDIGIEKIKESHYPYTIIHNNNDIFELIKRYDTDIVINDILNTDEEYISKLKKTGVRVVNFEDEGIGSNLADAVINALYEKESFDKKRYYGSDYYLIRDEFAIRPVREFQENVNEIIVLFGGTDPCNLTEKTLRAIMDIEGVHITVILGLGYDNKENITRMVKDKNNVEVLYNVKMMSEYMNRADIAISSQGRTMLELAAMGVPTVIMSENEREATHEFGSIKNGYLNLGAGALATEKTIYETVNWLIQCPQIRKNMRQQMLEKDLMHGFKRVKKIILDDMK